MAQPNNNLRANQNSNRSPELESLLTRKKQAMKEWDIAQQRLENALRDLKAFDQAQQHAQADRQEYVRAWNEWQAAQRFAVEVKAGETRISELKYRILLASVLAIGALILAAIQVTPSSMLVVVILGCLPCCLYVVAKVRQLSRVQQSLPSKSKIGDLAQLEKAADKWRHRSERSNADALALVRIAQKAGYGDRSILVSRVNQAQADVASWDFKVREAEGLIQSRVSLEQQRKKQNP